MSKQFYQEIKFPNAWSNAFIDHVNRRIRIDDYRGNLFTLNEKMVEIARLESLEKIIIKSRNEHLHILLELGFQIEGVVNGYFNGGDAYFVSKFLVNERRENQFWIKEDEIIAGVGGLNREELIIEEGRIKKAKVDDAPRLSKLYQEVFEIYPVPLQKQDYLEECLNSGTIFLFVEEGGEIVSAASAEINTQYSNAEMTDCATLPKHRGKGYMKQLLVALENELKFKNIYCAYTIARALSFGMNAAFHQLDYRYRGRLVNNCYIFDKMEDMNIWVKDLSKVIQN
ncbi:putative beta-lysine N-acetyltransferase [Rossellomorea sp. BNER]|uniref:putative beta-lysine N-acetyltransferase n=1 Tax=Rossellomorea sp. BNER TaxID=2962031 RepID=UPI003AF1F6BD|nr:putative beta-lysine N-acetyltransferase [Rossellomorea sp. BNER]